MNNFVENVLGPPVGSLLAMAATIVIVVLQFAIFYRRSLKDLTVGYRIAVIGLPRAGKTALIGAIFDRIFSSTSGRDFSPVGQETINRVNRIIANLNGHRPLPPTKEKDAFIFRFLYYIKRTLIFKGIRYEGEVVDFPGELSQQLLESADDGDLNDDMSIFHKEFFSWVISSRVHIFVVDLGQFLLSDDRDVFVAQISSEIRAAWQILNEEINRSLSPPERRVALVFTKSDLLPEFSLIENRSHEQIDILRQAAFDSPPRGNENFKVLDYESSYEGEQMVRQQFKALINYFTIQQCVFSYFLVSSYCTGGVRFQGINELIDFVLPESPIRQRSYLSRLLYRF